METGIEMLVRENVRAFVSYSSARSEFEGEARIFLDANENPREPWWGSLNRYPDPKQSALRKRFGEIRGVPAASVFAGNGSDEVIDLLYRVFCEPGRDAMIHCPPTYGMYETLADLNGVKKVAVPLAPGFRLDAGAILAAGREHAKLLFVCSPNNPTGNSAERAALIEILERFPGIVVVDEAYADFAPEGSAVSLLSRYPRLVIVQTLSKAWALAGLRIGFALASREIVAYLDRVKPPYNVSSVAQRIALDALSRPDEARLAVESLVAERERLREGLSRISVVRKIHPSDANFLLVEVESAREIYQSLREAGIVVRDRSSQPGCEGCLRITVGLPEENDSLLAALSRLAGLRKERPANAGSRPIRRSAKVNRVTAETRVFVQWDLDTAGVCTDSEIATGLGFFDHMLQQIPRHSGTRLTVRVEGDLHVDEHHVIEDTALALGSALSSALGDKRGVERYGFALPMDDCLAQVALDLSGRPWLVWETSFSRERVGDVPTEMFEHFFKSFCDSAGMNLNVRADGKNEHHKIESIFKAFSRALGSAIRRGAAAEIPSTKGVL